MQMHAIYLFLYLLFISCEWTGNICAYAGSFSFRFSWRWWCSSRSNRTIWGRYSIRYLVLDYIDMIYLINLYRDILIYGKLIISKMAKIVSVVINKLNAGTGSSKTVPRRDVGGSNTRATFSFIGMLFLLALSSCDFSGIGF